MKTTKKIFAAFLAVMMIALMIPFTASAADETYSVAITGKSGYTFTLYKVANVNPTTMTYSDYASNDVKSALETKVDSKNITDTNGNTKNVTGVDVQALLSACNALSDTQLAADGVKVTDFTTSYSNNIAAGVYFVKVTGYPTGVNVQTVNNSVFALPYYNGTTRTTSISFSAGGKITDNEPTVDKSFTGKTETAISEAIGTEISYTLTGSVVGSATQPATEYKFVDTMTKGLDYVDNSVSVKLTGKNDDGGNIEKVLTINDEYTVTYNAPDAKNRTLTVELAGSVLANTSDFYNYSNVVVTYKAKLNSNAVKGEKTDTIKKFAEGANAGKNDYANSTLNNNINYVELKYTANGTPSTLVGPYLKVYTYDLVVTKVDAANDATKLNGAGFTLYTDLDCTSVAANGSEQVTSGTEVVNNKEVAKGLATFTGLKAGTYYLKETKAPAGYNLNTSVFTITVPGTDTATTGIVNQTVTDSLLVTPNTGGMGTMMFTIGGAALIACAGVLFLIVRKKKSAK